MIERATALGLLLCAVGCVQVRWYPIYEDVAPDRAASSSADGAEAAKVPTHESPMPMMRIYPTDGEETRTRIESPWLRAALFPFNLVASMLSNGVAGCIRPFDRGCCMALPNDVLGGLFIFGPCDAWHGYPFWEPTELDPHSFDYGYSF